MRGASKQFRNKKKQAIVASDSIINIMKDGKDPEFKKDEDYPIWLYELT